LGFLYYAYNYIQATSIMIGGEVYYILFDDAMISMRYAYNLAHGFGAVWNPGEHVEGFTNPLWVGIMALINLLPIPLSKTGLVVQIMGTVFLTANLYFVRLVVEEFTDDLPTMLIAVALTAFYSPLITWGLLGMEVSLIMLMLTATVWIALRNGKERFTPWIYILLAISTLVRFDMAVPYLVVLGVMFFVQPQHRKQHLLWGIGLLILFLGGQTLARYFYYGEFLPNTYYLKVQSWPFALRVMRGMYAFIWFAYYNGWGFTLLPLAILVFRRDWKVMLLFLLLAGQIAYSIYVGGDAWEHHGGSNRYISIAMPIFFILFAWAVDELRKKVQDSLSGSWMVPIILRKVWLVIFVAAFFNFNLLLGSWKSIERLTLTRKPDYAAGSQYYLTIALNLQKVVTPDATVAVTAAGNTAYFMPDNYMIDLLGKADKKIAHGPVKTPMSIEDIPLMQPGHMKWDYAYSIGELQPDVIIGLREGTNKDAEPFLKNYVVGAIGDGIKVFLLKDSPNINWEKVNIKQ
jgi:hypothetical protein